MYPGEEIQKAFTTWRDMTLFTTTRILQVDVQGNPLSASTRTLKMRTVPYSSVNGFNIQSANWLFSGEIAAYTSMSWLPNLKMAMNSGSHLAELQNFLAHKVLGSQAAPLPGPSAELQGRRLQMDEFDIWWQGLHGKVRAEGAME